MSLFDKLRGKNKRKSVVIGLDGVPYTLLRNLRDLGCIPNMGAIFDKGYFGQMSVSLPEVSSVSWTSFMTGTQSGEHGIYGFMDLKPGTYDMYFPNFSHNKAATIWEELSGAGKKTVSINMPATYPAKKIDGALISGFVAIDINKAVYPASLLPALREMKYQIDVDVMKAREDHGILFRDLDITLDSRRNAADLLWREIDWDLFILVITGTDRLMHFLWDAYEDKKHAYHQPFLDYFKKVDGIVGRIYDQYLDLEGCDERNRFYMLSDHGFTKIKTEVYLNRWLHENGYLNFRKDNPETLMDIGQGSRAFALDPSRIYINLKEKYPKGTVEKEDYKDVLDQIIRGLETLTFEDNKIVKSIFQKEDIYSGPYLHLAPDLVVLSNHGYDLKGRLGSRQVFGRTNLQGMHTQDDAFVYCSNNENKIKTIFELKELIIGKNEN